MREKEICYKNTHVMREKVIGHVFLNRLETMGVGGQGRREGMMDGVVKDMVKGTPPTFVWNTEVHDEVYSPHGVCHHHVPRPILLLQTVVIFLKINAHERERDM